uniref:efflux RND transporter periplasmic adaptor subunit n=1 Tax=Paracoccus shandongensis TaxID=2816048 RepID=UPI001A8F5411
RAGLSQARQASDRASALLARGVGTRAARDEALQALSEAQGATERAESTLDQARRAVSDTILRAPTDAVVTARDMAPGQIVGAAQVVLTIATLEGLEAEFAAPDHPRLDSALGNAVRLDTIDIDRPPMRGTVSEISPLVDPATGSVTLRVRIDDVEGDTALLGAAVRGHVDIAANAGIAVPWTALMRDGDRPAVWRVDKNNRVSLVPVTIGHFANDVVYLSGGIGPGDVVVGAGSQLLYPGRQVQRAEVLP